MITSTIYTSPSVNMGRGVFAAVDFVRGDVIELCPIIEINASDKSIIHETVLHDYYFVWGENEEKAAIALGYGSLYNHSDTPNAQFVNDYDNELIIIECLSNIYPGDEIYINYIHNSSKEKLWFKT